MGIVGFSDLWTQIVTHQVPISNSQLCGYELIMSNDEVILFKIHSVQEMFSKHENLA